MTVGDRPRPINWLALVVLAVGTTGCDDLPRDPEGTLGRVQGGRLRVGLVENKPWVVRRHGEPAGAEVELVRRLAGELGATADWYWGGEQRHMEALEHFELDLVVGGITDDTPWEKRVGLAGPYFRDRILVGTPVPTPPTDLKGLQVAVEAGGPAVAYLRRKGGVPVPVRDVRGADGPVAAPDWQLEQLGLTPSGVELTSRKHVMAVPPGENGWVRRLEEFFDRQRGEVPGLLQKEVAAP